eukprot:1529485-Rhodomonas_salina.5
MPLEETRELLACERGTVSQDEWFMTSLRCSRSMQGQVHGGVQSICPSRHTLSISLISVSTNSRGSESAGTNSSCSNPLCKATSTALAHESQVQCVEKGMSLGQAWSSIEKAPFQDASRDDVGSKMVKVNKGLVHVVENGLQPFSD